MRAVEIHDGFEGFRKAAIDLLSSETPPDRIRFQTSLMSDLDANAPYESIHLDLEPIRSATSIEESIAAQIDAKLKSTARTAMIPSNYIQIALDVSFHASHEKWHLLYRLLWRLTHGSKDLLHNLSDPDVKAAIEMRKEVRREVHRLYSIICFHKATCELGVRQIAWLETMHPVLELATPYFVRSMSEEAWSILTPHGSAHWDGHVLTMSEPVVNAPKDESTHELWQSYRRSVFNPARVKIKAMRAHPAEKTWPDRYWAVLPETVDWSELKAVGQLVGKSS